ncbi:MAG TPA: exosortase/archaeosortase family protein [Clostridia bacterium]|nr:exosortase/archaeosortase family protein [Clostridia bacterium]
MVPNYILCILPLAWLWFRLVDHLRLEWSVNPQYTYGFAVPFLCVYLVWQRLRHPGFGKDRPNACFQPSPIALYCAFGLLLFAWLPTRLLQEANPEWRLVSWAMALEVVGLTLIVTRFVLPSGSSRHPELHRSNPHSSELLPALASSSTFPLWFFLICVPWPTVIEGPTIQGLARANAAVATELLDWIGVPAIQRGNIIEVGAGLVSIDEACSGIRSLQATLMLGLLFTGIYHLTPLRSFGLCCLGFLLAFFFNIIRTTLLAWVAAANGAAAAARWHDPAGTSILLVCFGCLWLTAIWLKGRRARSSPSLNPPLKLNLEMLLSLFCRPRSLLLWFFLGWLVLAELGTELWYRLHESRLPQTISWRVDLPTTNATFKVMPFSDKARQYLRFDEGLNGVWREDDGTDWQAIFLRWNPGRIAVHLAKNHTPESCLTAAGNELLSQSEICTIPVRGVHLPFRCYVMEDQRGIAHVFYCLWEDRASTQDFHTMSLTYVNRLEPVLAGRRNCGQRSLEIAVWGFEDAQEAEAAFRRQLTRLIKLE